MNLLYDVWLSLVFQTKTQLAFELLKEYGSAENIYNHAEDIAKELPQISTASKRLGQTGLDEAEQIMDFCERYKITILSCRDDRFPKPLSKIYDCPLVIYYKGNLPDFEKRFCVAVVGTRRMSDYGAQMTYKLSYDLIGCGAVVVSGMAEGIDSMAHFAALDGGGDTVAVLGCGFQYAYPSGHRNLMAALCSVGCVITEYAPSVHPAPQNFPRRNRIISGLCDCTALIEAPLRSGALITASFAEEQHRGLFILPGDANRASCVGSNRLIREGSSVFTTAFDIISEYEAAYRGTLFTENRMREQFYLSHEKSHRISELIAFERNLKGYGRREPNIIRESSNSISVLKNKIKAKKGKQEISSASHTEEISGLSEDEQKILQALSVPLTPDELSVKVNICISDVLQHLTMLEIKGLVDALAGGRFLSTEFIQNLFQSTDNNK